MIVFLIVLAVLLFLNLILFLFSRNKLENQPDTEKYGVE